MAQTIKSYQAELSSRQVSLCKMLLFCFADGLGLHNIGFARMITVAFTYDIGVAIYLGAHQVTCSIQLLKGKCLSCLVGGIGLINTQYGRMAQVLGTYDLGVTIFLGAHQVTYSIYSLQNMLVLHCRWHWS